MESEESRSHCASFMETNSNWLLPPTFHFLHIFQYLSAKEMLDVGLICRSRLHISYDEFHL